jgi:ABC-type molybdate transport system ATPase subunit
MRIDYRIERPIRLQTNFEVEGFTVLLGQSGEGKTTLLRAIAGLLPAQGEPFGGLLPQQRAVGYLPQGYRNLFTACVVGHQSETGVTLLEWTAANGAVLRVPRQPELAAGQVVQWTIAPTAVQLPSVKPEPHRIDNPVNGRAESRLNLGAHFQVALRCGTERLWLSAPRNLEWPDGLETGCEVTVDLCSDGLVCWPHPA